MNTSNKLTMLIAISAIIVMLVVFVSEWGTDALPYALGLGIAAIVTIYFIVKGVDQVED